MSFDYELADETSTVHPVHGDPDATLAIDGRPARATLEPGTAPGEYVLEIDGHREIVFAARRGDSHFVHLRGRSVRVEALDALVRAQREAAPDGAGEALRAPMPGVVIDVAVEVGDTVAPGQLLMTIESMKLQTAIVAPHEARVSEIAVARAGRFDQGAVLVRLEATSEEGPST
jgi:3-methylcrotonyl-CoA carboxylase alpha subunit